MFRNTHQSSPTLCQKDHTFWMSLTFYFQKHRKATAKSFCGLWEKYNCEFMAKGEAKCPFQGSRPLQLYLSWRMVGCDHWSEDPFFQGHYFLIYLSWCKEKLTPPLFRVCKQILADLSQKLDNGWMDTSKAPAMMSTASVLIVSACDKSGIDRINRSCFNTIILCESWDLALM